MVRILAPGEAPSQELLPLTLRRGGSTLCWRPEQRGMKVHVSVWPAESGPGPALGRLVMTLAQWLDLAALLHDNGGHGVPGP
jgi:hypothetical protein